MAETDSALVDAMERNLAAYWLDYGRVSSGEVYEESNFGRFCTPILHPLFNGAFCTHLSQEHAALVAPETVAYFRQKRRPAFWWVGPSAGILRAQLIALGVRHVGSVPGMVLDLTHYDENGEVPQGLTIKHLPENDLESIRQWCEVVGRANGITGPMLTTLADVTCQRPASPDRLRRYLAYYNNQPVAASELLLDWGVAGLFAIATDESARGRGFGRAITAICLRDAKAIGYNTSVLQSSEMGFPVYRKLGFEPLCTLDLFLLGQ